MRRTPHTFPSYSSLVSFIKCVEKLARGSLEYREWLKRVREQGGYKCSVCGLTLDETSIEIHHTPLTLYDIAEYALLRLPCATTLQCANYVMYLHERDLVGWVPLCKSHHEAVHNFKCAFDVNGIKGGWRELLTIVPDDIRHRAQSKIKWLEKWSNIPKE